MQSAHMGCQAPPVQDVEALIRGVEDACRAGRPLSQQEIACLDIVRQARLSLLASGEDPARLRSFGQRLWCACGAAGAVAIAPLPEAKLRQTACELVCSSFAGSRETEPRERATAAAQWTLAGKAWLQAGSDDEALKCFQYAVEPWVSLGLAGGTVPGWEEAHVTMAEIATQALIWSSEVHFKQEDYEKAFDSLAQARDALSVSLELLEVMLDDLLRTCYVQAVAHRNAGNTTLAINLMNLALAALQAPGLRSDIGEDSITRARLLQELALCYAAACDTHLSLLHIREAVNIAPESSKHQVAALKAWLHILCQLQFRNRDSDGLTGIDNKATGAAAGSDLSGLEAQIGEVSRRLMREPAMLAAECLGACELLLKNGVSQDVVYVCLDELGKRVHADPHAFCEVLAFRLCLASRAAEAALACKTALPVCHEALDRLNAAVLEAEEAVRNSVAKPTLVQAAAKVLWHFGGVLRDSERNDDAVLWFGRMIPFLTSPAELADCWCAVAVCHWRAGRREETRQCTEKVLSHDRNHLHGSLLQLLCLPTNVAGDSAEAAEEDASAVVELLERLQSHPSFLPMHASCVAQALLHHPRQELALSALEVLARCLLRESKEGSSRNSATGAETDSSSIVSSFKALPQGGLRVIRELVLRALAQKRPDTELVRHFNLAADQMAVQRLNIADALRCGEAHNDFSLVLEVRRIFLAAWTRGKELGQQSRWAESASMFEVAHRLLEQLESVEVHEVIEARAWCRVLIASASLQRVKDLAGKLQERKELLERALHCLDCAHQLCRKAKHLQAKGDIAQESAEGTATMSDGRIFRVLVLLEFEVRCLAGDSELQLRCFVDQVTQQEAVGIQSLLAMSKIASAAWMRRLALHCLQRYLRVFVGVRGVADYSKCAVAYREMISMHASRNESFVVYEGILQLLSGTTGSMTSNGPEGRDSSAADNTEGNVQGELEWLVSTAWNNGVHFCKLQQYRWGERWMGKSIELAKFCPGVFVEEEMHQHYMQCLQHCSE